MFKCQRCLKYTLKERCKCGSKTDTVGYKFKFMFLNKKLNKDEKEN